MNKKLLPCRVIPHEQYIKAMILSGMSQEDINLQTSCEGFNIISDVQFKNIETDCLNIPDGKKMIKTNKDNQKKKKAPYISDKVVAEFKYPDYFIDILYQCLSYPQKRHHCKKYHSINSLLSERKIRTFLEISAMINLPLKEIKKAWGKLVGTKLSSHSNSKMACFYYYYWRFTINHMRRNSATRGLDIVRYLDLNSDNQYYYPHRQMVFSSPEVLYSYFGILSNDDRRMMEKEEYGRCHQIIMKAFDNQNYALASWVVSEHSRISQAIDKDEGQEGKEHYQQQLERIFSRTVTRTDDHSRSDLERDKRRLAREPEQDEPYEIKPK